MPAASMVKMATTTHVEGADDPYLQRRHNGTPLPASTTTVETTNTRGCSNTCGG